MVLLARIPEGLTQCSELRVGEGGLAYEGQPLSEAGVVSTQFDEAIIILQSVELALHGAAEAGGCRLPLLCLSEIWMSKLTLEVEKTWLSNTADT